MNFSLSSTRTSSVFKLDAGTSTFLCFALHALRMHVRRSATGSLTDLVPFQRRRAASALPSGLTLAERHVHEPQELLPFLVVLGRRDERDIHPPDLLDLVVVDLREDDLLGDPERVVALAVERLHGHAAEVADSRQRNID